MVDVIFFTIINFVSSDFPSVANQWSMGSYGPYSNYHLLAIMVDYRYYLNTCRATDGCYVGATIDFCEGEATVHCPIRGQSIEGFYTLLYCRKHVGVMVAT